MSKLLGLKSWLTVTECARYLSTALGERVSAADIYQLALDHRLTLSVHFVNGAYAKQGKIVPLDQCERIELPSFFEKNTTITYYEGATVISDGTAIKYEGGPKPILGIWDLPMIGGEKQEIAYQYHTESHGPEPKWVYPDGIFIGGEDGTVWQLLGEFDKKTDKDRASGEKLSRLDPSRFYPAGEFPSDSAIVVRPQAISAFLEALAPPESKEEEKFLGEKERTSLLKLVIAMAIKGYGYTPHAKKSPTATEIASDMTALGISMDADTVRKWLKEAAQHLPGQLGKPNSV